MSTLKETVYAGRNNVIRLALSEDGVLFHDAYPTTTPERWVLTINADTPIIIDSDVSPEAVAWDETTSVLELRLGAFVTDPLAFTLCTLVLYTAEWPDGLVWINPTCTPDKLQIRICDN